MSISTLTLNYKSKIAIPFGELQSVLDWCDLNCQGEWSFNDSVVIRYEFDQDGILKNGSIDYIFSFESEKDYLAFILVYE